MDIGIAIIIMLAMLGLVLRRLDNKLTKIERHLDDLKSQLDRRAPPLVFGSLRKSKT